MVFTIQYSSDMQYTSVVLLCEFKLERMYNIGDVGNTASTSCLEPRYISKETYLKEHHRHDQSRLSTGHGIGVIN